jgi:beta-aspartyl-dipeptidase (metallo-type)
MLVLIENGDVYAPEPIGEQSLLLANDRIERIGSVDRRALDQLEVEHEVIDASDCYVVPGLVDPHAHLLGGSGEGGLAHATPMVFVDEIAGAGVTTVVGTLGVDTTMKTIEGLLGRVKALNDLGLSACMWTGGYNIPPTTLLSSVRQDMMFVAEVIGAGEIAISDERGLQQSAQELAKVVRDTHVGGLLSGKCGLSHFHVGSDSTRLQPLRDIVEKFHVKCDWLYPTHIQRNERLLKEAVAFACEGMHVNMDIVNEDLHVWLPRYLDMGGPLDKLSISSDMDSSTPDIFFTQFCGLVVKHGFALEDALQLFTSNTATALGLSGKGRIKTGGDADLVILSQDGLAIRHVIARGKVVVRDGEVCIREKWLEESKRSVAFTGDEYPPSRVRDDGTGARV